MIDTARLKKIAQYARRALLEQVSAKLTWVLAEDSAARRESPEAVQALEKAIATQGQAQLIDRVAYTWFNRFCALRFMDVNRYTRAGVVSPAEGQFQPEILANAKMGYVDEDMSETTQQKVFALLSGTAPSPDPQGEAYRLLVVAACNAWYKAMPFLFERINDYTELLMPGDLLSGASILAYIREAMTPIACEKVEVIGWLYQFYISEKKDEVFNGLKKNQKITPENIPAATQLFTPHWIVRYLVENSLGRLWMLNRPKSRLVERMEYYIKPQTDGVDQPETDFLRIENPEEIKICDPACGSGHMLTYAFDLLYAMYEEEGADPTTIAEKILTHNLFGVEIDERAGDLAAFALVMKARAKSRRFLSKPVQPNICVLENVTFTEGEIKQYIDAVGRDLFSVPLLATLHQFDEAKNFGSLIRPEVGDVNFMLQHLAKKGVGNTLLLYDTHQKVLTVLEQAEYLSQRYHVVIANPPYMGSKGMNTRLGTWAKDNYPDSKKDLFAMFIERGFELVLDYGFSAQITMESWMFLPSYEVLRKKIVTQNTISTLGHFPYDGKKPTVMGINFGTSAFVVHKVLAPERKGNFFCSRYFELQENGHPRQFPTQNERYCSASAADFAKIPGSPVAYWVSEKKIDIFEKKPKLTSVADIAEGTTTGDVNLYLKKWFEVNQISIGFNCKDSSDASMSSKKWFPYNKGGEYRKWYGNNEFLINWENNGDKIKKYSGSFVRGEKFYFKEGITWSKVSSSALSFRYFPKGFLFDTGGLCLFSKDTLYVLALLNSHASSGVVRILAPTLNFTVGAISNIPVVKTNIKEKKLSLAVALTRSDWDAYETSWDFTSLPLLALEHRKSTLAETYATLRKHWQGMTDEMQKLEEENNRIFIEAYGLQDELTPDVPLKEITLTCNPHYRYGGNKTPEELEALLLADTMREFISYAVGCMFGRYSLDAPGLILANQGETVEDFSLRLNDICGWGIPTHENADPQDLRDATVERCHFLPDEDNVIPILDGYWFEDDMVERFQNFVRLTFEQENYAANVAFIEQALGKNLRTYLLKDFYADHLKRYKKRPIYWLFSSPSGSFNALIYMHRYRPDTVSVVLNNYLREFRTKLKGRKEQLEAVSISASASQSEKTKALKEIEKLKKMLTEIDDYERDTLYPLATRQISIDLDDGVKVNYLKFSPALKKIPGLEAKDE